MDWQPKQGYIATDIYPYTFDVYPYEKDGITRWGWIVQDYREAQGDDCGHGIDLDTAEDAMAAAELWLEGGMR
jgi:hypothetical protein